MDNCQDTIFGGFAPNSQTAEVLSKAMGSRTVMSGSISRGKNDPSQSLQLSLIHIFSLLETATVHAGGGIIFRFKDGTEIEVGAE